MSDLMEIYKEVILDHNKAPRNFGKPESLTNEAKGHNPLCGDQIDVYLTIADDKIEDIHFDGKGCAICAEVCPKDCIKMVRETEIDD